MFPILQFKDYIKLHALFAPQDKILLAVSGGKDSVLMAHFFNQAGFNFGIAHCNFNLRGAEAQRDEDFVKQLADDFKVAFYVKSFETQAFASQHKISTQMAARTLRYQWFEELRQQENYQFIALAQHQNDAVETVLLNLIRGTGISGLHGILPKRAKLIRPLMFLTAAQVNNLVLQNNVNFVEDSSNQSNKYLRNKLRLQVIPILQEINPNLNQTFEQNINRFAATEMVLQQVVAQLRNEVCTVKGDAVFFNLDKIKQLNPQQLLLFELLKPYGFVAAVVNQILESLSKQSGTLFYSPSHCAAINRGNLVVSVIKTEMIAPVFVKANDKKISFGQYNLNCFFSDDLFFEKNISKIYVDTALLVYPLSIRHRLNGDKFKPLGMSNFKKLSDFFIDEKVPLYQKDNTPILINGNQEIIWVIGLRQDNRYKVQANTKKVTIFELTK